MTPSWTRWLSRGLRMGAAIIALTAIVVAVGGARGTAMLMICAAAWPAIVPWLCKIAYRNGYYDGKKKAIQDLEGAWDALASNRAGR